MSIKIYFGTKSFFTAVSKNTLKIDGYVESLNMGIIKDLVFLELIDGKNKNNSINLSIDVFKLRGLLYGMRELKEKETNFKLYTESNGIRNSITLKSDKKAIYINFISTDGRKNQFLLGLYGFNSFIDSVEMFCNELEIFTYEQQRKISNKGTK